MFDNKSIVIGIIIGIFLVYLITTLFISHSDAYVPDSLDIPIQVLVRQAARWSTAAEQDESPMIAVLHANYGAGYLWALKDIAKDDQIEKAANIDIKKFMYEITKAQDNATKRMAGVCPKYAPKQTYLTKIGGEGGNN
jgi:hypothetical protein